MLVHYLCSLECVFEKSDCVHAMRKKKRKAKTIPISFQKCKETIYHSRTIVQNNSRYRHEGSCNWRVSTTRSAQTVAMLILQIRSLLQRLVCTDIGNLTCPAKAVKRQGSLLVLHSLIKVVKRTDLFLSVVKKKTPTGNLVGSKHELSPMLLFCTLECSLKKKTCHTFHAMINIF